MTKTMTVAELSRDLGVSVNTVWKKIAKKGLITDKQMVNNREITVVLLSDEEYSDLIDEKNSSSPINNGVNNPNYEDSLSINNMPEGLQPASNQVDVVYLVESIINYSKDMNNQVKEYVDRVINAEKQVKLLEDIENRNGLEFHELTASNKSLEDKVASLEAEKHAQSEKIDNLVSQNARLEAKISELEEQAKKRTLFGIKLY